MSLSHVPVTDRSDPRVSLTVIERPQLGVIGSFRRHDVTVTSSGESRKRHKMLITTIDEVLSLTSIKQRISALYTFFVVIIIVIMAAQ